MRFRCQFCGLQIHLDHTITTEVGEGGRSVLLINIRGLRLHDCYREAE